MKKISFLFLIVYLFSLNNAYALLNLKTYTKCDMEYAGNFILGKKPYGSFKYFAFDKKYFYWDYDEEKEEFSREMDYSGKNILVSEIMMSHIKFSDNYRILFRKKTGVLEIYFPKPDILALKGFCEKTTKFKMNKSKF